MADSTPSSSSSRLKDFVFLTKLGQGSYGSVYKVNSHTHTHAHTYICVYIVCFVRWWTLYLDRAGMDPCIR